MNLLSLRWRGPLLVAFPLLCQMIFIFAIIYMLVTAQQSLEKAVHMREVLMKLNYVSTGIIDGVCFQDESLKGVSGQSASKHPMVKELDALVKSLPSLHAERMKQKVDDLLATVDYSVSTLSTKQVDKADKRREVYILVFRTVPSFLAEVRSVVDSNNKLRTEEFNKFAKAKDNILGFINNAIIASILVAIAMFVLFIVSIKRPIEHIAENSKRLSKKTPLLPPLKNQDELSRLDKSLHQTFDAVVLASERELALINNVSDLVCSLSQEGIFLESNAAALRILGIPADELTGKSIVDIAIPAESFLAEEYLRKACQPGEIIDFELKLQTAAGSEIETHWSAIWSPLRRRLFCVVRDVTAEKAVARMKQDFVDMVSHDLRSPLTSLRIALEMIEIGTMGEINADAMNELQATNKNVQILINFINDLLDFQKLDEGRVQLDKAYCSANEIIKEAISLVKEVAGAKQITIEFSSQDFEIFCDQLKITQTVLNLLSNAIKFSPANSSVAIALTEVEIANDMTYVKVEVKDNGPGIADDIKERIFEPFEQAPSHKSQGTGLGLAICKMIVTSHGGEIGVTKNENGSGSVFWFTVPTSEDTQAQVHSSPSDQNLFLD